MTFHTDIRIQSPIRRDNKNGIQYGRALFPDKKIHTVRACEYSNRIQSEWDVAENAVNPRGHVSGIQKVFSHRLLMETWLDRAALVTPNTQVT